jgi:TonB family protein
LKKVLFATLGLIACSHPAPPPAAPVAAERAPAPPPAAPAEEPKDDLQVSGTLGTLNDEEIAGPFQRSWDEVTECYQQAQQKLWYVGGRVEIHVKIDQAGEPRAAWVSSSTFGNYDAERCLVAVAQKLHFSKPHGGREAEFTYPIEFRSRSAITTWDEARVAPHMMRHKQDVRTCKVHGRLPPTLMLTMYVAPGGRVTSAGLAADAPLDENFAACLVGKTRAWKLEDPLGHIAKATVGVKD